MRHIGRGGQMADTRGVEEQIRDAMAAGEFDNLPGKGKPLDLDTYFRTPEHLRMAFHILKGAGYVPPELALKRKIEKLKILQENTDDPVEKTEIAREIAAKTAVYEMALEQNRRAR